MEISRIQAFRPSIIDWKNLTAREIIKYKSSGIEVPNLYYQWAVSFINEVENARNDNVTYESAISNSRHFNNDIDGSKNIDLNTPDDENLDDKSAQAAQAYGFINIMENPQTSAEKEKQEDQKFNAKETRENMLKDSYTKKSISSEYLTLNSENGDLAQNSTENTERVRQNSLSEISILESEMNTVISKINEYKNQMNALKNEPQNVSQIGLLNQQLKLLSVEAQSNLSNSVDDFENFDLIISDDVNISSLAAEFGNEALISAEKIPENTEVSVFKQLLKNSSMNSVNQNNNLTEILNSTNDLNNSNISNANSYFEKLQFNTQAGVVSEENVDLKDNKIDVNQIDEKTKEYDKDIKTSNNDGSDSSDKLHINIDEIVKYKIRTGKYSNNEI